jgi:hypothetical protein
MYDYTAINNIHYYKAYIVQIFFPPNNGRNKAWDFNNVYSS